MTYALAENGILPAIFLTLSVGPFIFWIKDVLSVGISDSGMGMKND
ncbi:MAG: hypothetical protein KUG73_04640 [Pseudomonadales bacterium]|nr:hypothetical protein [Pseudomonadales bacterium]